MKNIKFQIIKCFCLVSLIIYSFPSMSEIVKSDTECHKCIELMQCIDEKTNITFKDTQGFLNCFNHRYANCIELIEFRNQTLFLILQHQPKQLFKAVAIDNAFNLIKEDLENPISDTIDIKNIRTTILKIKSNINIRNQIIKSIDAAIEKERIKKKFETEILDKLGNWSRE